MLALWLACADPPPPHVHPDPGSPSGETGSPTSSTGTTGTTGDTAPPVPACDDGLGCSAESVDDQGRCLETPLYDCGWPAAAPSGAINLTGIDAGLRSNLSGLAWNAHTRDLWLVRNSGPSEIWRVVEGTDGWRVAVGPYGIPATWSDLGDLEAVTLFDPVNAPFAVTVVDEATTSLVRYDLTTGGTAVELERWDLSAWLPDAPPLGAEAVAFVPDDALSAWGFTDDTGRTRVSTLGLGGLVFVGHQNGGRIYAFDLSLGDDQVVPVAVFDTARDETSELDFDASTGRLYVWHGGAWNDLEVVRLSSAGGSLHRALDREYLFDQPDDGNLEGMVVFGTEDCVDGGRPLLLSDDDGGDRALLEYPDWPIGCR